MQKHEHPVNAPVRERGQFRPSRRACIAALLAALAPPLASATGKLAGVADLRAHARQAQALGQPLIVLISLPDCGYCERVKRSHLLSMAQSTRYEVREVMLNGSGMLRDFNGSEVRAGDWTHRIGARLAPTLYFFAPDGRMAAPPLVGAGLEDFYGSLLEQRLQEARDELARRR